MSPTGLLDPFSDVPQLACAACPIGQYSSVSGGTSCVACPAGTTTFQEGATSAALCYDPSAAACAPGAVSVNRHEPCQPCPVGTFQARAEQASCTPCPRYTQGTVAGADSADACVLQPPKAFWVYNYDAGKRAAPLAGEVGGDRDGFINLLQSGSSPLSLSSDAGTVSRRCVETVNTTFATNDQYCWNSWCTSQLSPPCSDPVCDLITAGASSNAASPSGNNGEWYYFPAGGECNAQSAPGDKCTWSEAALVQSVPLQRLHGAGLVVCALLPNSMWTCSLTPGQWHNSTRALDAMLDMAPVTTHQGAPRHAGPVKIKDGRCVGEHCALQRRATLSLACTSECSLTL